MSFKSALLAVVALLAAAGQSHIIMQSPVPYSVDKIDNGPLTAAQFPCKQQNGFTVSKMNEMKVGEKQQISFKGTAVHGGGSCQLSVTTDKEPNANSVFKVVKSIEGGCPGVSGVNTYDFELPDSIPNGDLTFAWTWMPKLSGQPEYYMNCAPIRVTGGAEDTSKFNQLPDMFVANINDCKTPVSKAVKFPNPGTVVEDGGTNDLAPPTGNCPAPGGVFAPLPSSEPTTLVTKPIPTPTSAVSVAPSAPAGTGSPGIPTPIQPSPIHPTGAPIVPAPSGPATNPPSTGGENTCSEQGAIVCNGPNQFGLCDNGSVVWRAVAPGTTCSNGTIQKRDYYIQLRGRVQKPRKQ